VRLVNNEIPGERIPRASISGVLELEFVLDIGYIESQLAMRSNVQLQCYGNLKLVLDF
jgi:hypothetical protein